MNVKIKALTAGVLFFVGAEAVMAQKKDSAATKQIEEVVLVGYGTQKKSEITASISSVKGSEIANLNTPTFEAQLAGRAAGVQVIQNTGLIGAAPVVNIRGINSISSGTEPLYVVDGMPVFSGSTGGGYTPSNALGDINPNDIESIEVLKDGSATAIYGSRGANGVILITTKKGKGGRFTLNYNNLTTYATVAKYFDILNTQQFLEISAEKNPNWASGSLYNTDWQRAVMRTGSQTDNNVSFSGGMGKGKYFASLGHTWQEGVIKANSMQRWSARFNADQKIFNDKVTVGVDFGITKTGYSGLNNGENSLSGAMYNALRQLPNTPIYDASNSTGYNIITEGTRSYVGRGTNNAPIANFIPNIVMVLDTNIQTSNLTRILGNVYATTDITSWMSYKFQASVDNSQTRGLQFWNRVHGDGFSRGGLIEQSSQDLLRWNIQNILNLKKAFADHNFNLTLINEYQKEDSSIFWGGGQGLSNDFFGSNVISNSYETQTSGGGRSDSGFISYAGRLNYNFANKYFLQGSLRYDGLSNLPKENRWGVFPGVSAGWTVSKENFMSSLSDVISDFKLRGSWAVVGNSDIGFYRYLGLYSNARYGDATGIAFSQTGNPDLQWETSEKIDFGLDFGLFKNRIKLTADYYKNDINNLILGRLYPVSSGLPGDGLIFENIGRTVNSGFEFTLDADVIKKGDFSWNANFNLTTVENEIKELVDGQDLFSGIGTNTNLRVNRVGEAINSLYGYRYYGVNMANGNPVYYKSDGSLVQKIATSGAVRVYDPSNPSNVSQVGTLTGADMTILGRSLPKFFGAFNNTFKYKNFDLNALVRFNYGNEILNLTRRDLLSMEFSNNSTEILGRWQSATNPGDGKTPIIVEGANNILNDDGVGSSRFIEDGSFIKIDNITLGYNFDKNIISKAYLTNLRIFVQAQNAFIFTKYSGADPELVRNGIDWNTIPRQRSFSIGINASF